MKPAVIRLVDLGLDKNFGASMTAAQALIDAMLVREGHPVAEVEFIRSRDSLVIEAALRAPAHVLYITSHGSNDEESLGFWSHDLKKHVSLLSLANNLAAAGEGIIASVLFADCCTTAQGRFVRAIRNCLEAETVYIGTSQSVTWPQSTMFASSFFAAYLKDRGRGKSQLDRGLAAAARAVDAYAAVYGSCSFKPQILKPSRVARRAFAS